MTLNLGYTCGTEIHVAVKQMEASQGFQQLFKSLITNCLMQEYADVQEGVGGAEVEDAEEGKRECSIEEERQR